MPQRCAWADGDPLLRAYHDEEWGVPEYDSRALWEKLMLDGFQAGLSWLTILRKRNRLPRSFQEFRSGESGALRRNRHRQAARQRRYRALSREDRCDDRRCPGL